jgi:tripeptide aminopeptidase
MKPAINRERLAATFTELCEISSPSRQEGNIAADLRARFHQLGADAILEDDSASRTGSEVGNLIIRFNGNLPDQPGLFFSCHMDTVGPCQGVKVVRQGDIFTSQGETILGGDDKSGIAAVLEMLTLLREQQTPHPMLEIIITTCEEIGLQGAKNLDFSLLRSGYGYALDSSGIDHVVIGAPAANRIKVDIHGRAAHAGLCPEEGINALAVAAQALAGIQMGRIDAESTCNFGLIEGGVATNIVPAQVTLRGEVRSHSPAKLVRYTENILNRFEEIAAAWRKESGSDLPTVEFETYDDYPALQLSHDDPVVQRVKAAARLSGKDLSFILAGGGSDANIFCGRGLPTAIIATGMNQVHTVNEQLDLNDMVSLTELLFALATVQD